MSHFPEKRSRAPFVGLLVVLVVVAAVLGGLLSLYLANHFDLFSAEDQTDSAQVGYGTTRDEGVSQVTAIADEVSPAVVCITNIATIDDFYMGTTETAQGAGSGVIVSADGYIVTNNHVVNGAQKISVGMADGQELEASLVAADAYTDLAVIKVEGSNLPYGDFADSDKVVVGELAVAIGNPGGESFARSVTCGVVSGLNRMIVTSEGQQSSLIQTDAAINPGNSGGALVNGNGDLIGINTVKISSTEFEGMGFAIPSNTVKEITDQLISNGKVTRPALGVTMLGSITSQIASYNNLPVDYGVVISPVSGGAAAAAGMQTYDVIIAIDDQTIKDTYNLQQNIFNKQIGDTVIVTALRQMTQGHFEEKDFTVKLGELN